MAKSTMDQPSGMSAGGTTGEGSEQKSLTSGASDMMKSAADSMSDALSSSGPAMRDAAMKAGEAIAEAAIDKAGARPCPTDVGPIANNLFSDRFL